MGTSTSKTKLADHVNKNKRRHTYLNRIIGVPGQYLFDDKNELLVDCRDGVVKVCFIYENMVLEMQSVPRKWKDVVDKVKGKHKTYYELKKGVTIQGACMYKDCKALVIKVIRHYY